MIDENIVPADPVARINFLRQKVLNGEKMDNQEVKEAISLLRLVRKDKDNSLTSKESKKSTKKPSVELPADLNDLF